MSITILNLGGILKNCCYFYNEIKTMAEAILSFQQASIDHEENCVLSEVSVEVASGDFVYLIGRTGSGKSSFMKTLYADLPLKKGSGHIVGVNLANLKDKNIPALRRKIGIVFQDFKLLPDRSVAKNLMFVLKATGWKEKEKMNARIAEVLAKVNLSGVEHKLPHTLSGGEQQRVAIARALLNEPELILADEPTGNLDPLTSQEVMTLLREINASGTTILMATHDYNLIVKYPSTTLKCEDGKVFEVVQT